MKETQEREEMTVLTEAERVVRRLQGQLSDRRQQRRRPHSPQCLPKGWRESKTRGRPKARWSRARQPQRQHRRRQREGHRGRVRDEV